MSTNSLLSAVPKTLLLLACIVIVILAALGVRSWLAARQANAQLAVTIATQQKLLDQATSRQRQRDSALAASLAAIDKAKNKVRTPAEVAAQLPFVLPPLPLPVSVTLPGDSASAKPQLFGNAPNGPSRVASRQAGDGELAMTGEESAKGNEGNDTKQDQTGRQDKNKDKERDKNKDGDKHEDKVEGRKKEQNKNDQGTDDGLAPETILKTPSNAAAPSSEGASLAGPHSAADSAAVIAIPQPDLKPLYDSLQDCRVCQAQRATDQNDLADERAKVTALTAERDAALKAAHGGGFWSHVAHGAKWFVIGAAIGAASEILAHR